MFTKFVLFSEGFPPLRCSTEWDMEDCARRLYRRGHSVVVAAKSTATGKWTKWLFVG